MFRCRARPEDAFLAVDSVPGYPVVVANPAFRRDAQLVKDLFRRFVFEFVRRAQPRGDIADDLPVGARIAGRINGFLDGE